MANKNKSVTTFLLGIRDNKMKAQLPASPIMGANILWISADSLQHGSTHISWHQG